jgi:hypothetical protein
MFVSYIYIYSWRARSCICTAEFEINEYKWGNGACTYTYVRVENGAVGVVAIGEINEAFRLLAVGLFASICIAISIVMITRCTYIYIHTRRALVLYP